MPEMSKYDVDFPAVDQAKAYRTGMKFGMYMQKHIPKYDAKFHARAICSFVATNPGNGNKCVLYHA